MLSQLLFQLRGFTLTKVNDSPVRVMKYYIYAFLYHFFDVVDVAVVVAFALFCCQSVTLVPLFNFVLELQLPNFPLTYDQL